MWNLQFFEKERKLKNETFPGIRDLADEPNQADLSQFKLTAYLLPNKFSCIEIMNLKCQFESNGFTLNLSESLIFSLIRMFKNFLFFLLIFFSTVIIQSSPKRKKKTQKSSARKYNTKMLVVETCAKRWWPVKENIFQLIVSTRNSHFVKGLLYYSRSLLSEKKPVIMLISNI